MFELSGEDDGGTRKGQKPCTANKVAFALCHCSCAVSGANGGGVDASDDVEGGELAQVVLAAVSALHLGRATPV